jgi:hypothetical protein
VTGICEEVGFSAPVLGGGHGWLQGQYGLAADQVISARVVVPNGDIVTVSEDSNPDLFWAIRGAGHNFGFVTEWTYRIYDMNPQAPKWSYDIFIFSGDKLEEVFNLHNELQKSQPAHAIIWSYITRVEQIDPDHVSRTLPLRRVKTSCMEELIEGSPSSGMVSFTTAPKPKHANSPNPCVISKP